MEKFKTFSEVDFIYLFSFGDIRKLPITRKTQDNDFLSIKVQEIDYRVGKGDFIGVLSDNIVIATDVVAMANHFTIESTALMTKGDAYVTDAKKLYARADIQIKNLTKATEYIIKKSR